MKRALGFIVHFCLTFLLFAAGLIVLWGCSRKPKHPSVDAAAMFARRCASCHRDGNDMRAPEPQALREMSKDSILAALDSGRMKWEAKSLAKTEKVALAEYLGKSDVTTVAEMTGYCPRDLDPPANPPIWSGWGVDLHNTRFQNARSAGLNLEKIKNLKLKWAFGFPGAAATFGQPTSYAGKLFVGSEDGTVYALDAATGCTWWAFRASATVKTAISVGDKGRTLYFGDTDGYIYALNVADGSVNWKVHPESHPAARITGSPLLVEPELLAPHC